MFGGWVVTIVVVAATTALFYAQGVYAPSCISLESIQTYEDGINTAVMKITPLLDNTDQTSVSKNVSYYEENKQDTSDEQINFLLTVMDEVVERCVST